MKEARYFFVPDARQQTELPAEEALHALRVLRLREGDEIFLMDGCGTFFRAEVSATDKRHCCYRILDEQAQQKTWHSHIHLAIAPTKMMERMEWMAEKATEVGFDELTFLESRNSERKVLRVDRVEKIVVSAVKQSRKPWIPRVNPMSDFKKFVARPFKGGYKYIAHCHDEIARRDLFHELSAADISDVDDVVVMIGPEGDFTHDEVRTAINNGFIPVSLGESRLRTETAGLSAVMMAQLCLRRIAFLFLLLACLLTSCSNRDYVASIPAETTAVVAVTPGKTKATDSKALLKSFMQTDKVEDGCGLDFSEKVYLFVAPDGMFGLCFKVLDRSDLSQFFSRLADEGRCSSVVSRRGFDFTVVDRQWIAGFSDDALLIMGPVAPMSQAACQQRMSDYLSQTADESIIVTPLFARLDSIDAPMSMVAQVQALPEMLSAPLMLGAPKDATAAQVLLASAMHVEDKTLFVEGSTFSLNPRIDAAIANNLQTMRPIGDTFLHRVPAGVGTAFFVNVSGTAFLPLLQASQATQTYLAGINTAIDIDNIIRSVDGDVCLTVSPSAAGRSMAMGAVLGHSRWLADVGYWKTSCPAGSRIDDWTSNAFIFRNGSTSYHFGVSPDGLYYSGANADEATMFLSDNPAPLPSAITDVIRNSRMALVVNTPLGGQQGSEPAAVDNNKSLLLKPLLGDVETIVYYNRGKLKR